MSSAPSITILYAGICGLILLILSLNIFREWVIIAITNKAEGEQHWKRSERAQHNFIEFVPMCLLLLFLIEIHGAPHAILHGIGVSLVIARVLHAYGVGNGKLASLVRVIGTQITFLILMICSLASIYYAVVPLITAKGALG